MLRPKGMILLLGIVLVLLAVPMVAAGVVINEIMYDPNQCYDEYCEWIELYNNGTESINLSEWSVCVKDLLMGYVDRNGSIHLNTSSMLASGGYAIITDGESGTEVYDNFVVDSSSIALHTEASTICGGLNNIEDTISVKDGTETIVTYYSSWGANGNGKSLQLVGGSWCEGPPTPGAVNGCQYCGDNTCDADEDCSNCPADCGECDGESCSIDDDCASTHCVHEICRATDPYCGDDYCDSGENCTSCAVDCVCGSGKICCVGTCYTGNCCVDANCTSPQTCVSHTCTTLTHYCGDGTCDANETCSCSDCEGEQNGCASKQLCCPDFPDCVDLCFSDADCPTGTVCRDPGTCNASCVDASEVVCDLTLSISAEEIFKSSIGEHYYLYVNDTKGNYTGPAVVGYWIEYSNGSYIRYHKPYNTTINVNVNKSRDYTPGEICGNETYYIEAEIVDPKCNDTDLTNNAATKAVTIWGLDPKSAECFKNLTYSLEIPVEVKAEENFTISVEIKNNQNVSQKVEVWSYVYRWGKCYSCYWNKTEESNKQMISIPAGSSITVELQNKVNATNGTYYIKVKILKEGFSTPEELLYEVEVIREEVPIEEDMEEEGEGEGEVIYKSKAEKIKKIAMYALPALLLIVAIYFVIVKRKQINEFVASKHRSIKERIAAKKQEAGKKREWKKYLQKRRPGVIERLSKGFLKPGGEAKE